MMMTLCAENTHRSACRSIPKLHFIHCIDSTPLYKLRLHHVPLTAQFHTTVQFSIAPQNHRYKRSRWCWCCWCMHIENICLAVNSIYVFICKSMIILNCDIQNTTYILYNITTIYWSSKICMYDQHWPLIGDHLPHVMKCWKFIGQNIERKFVFI